MARVTMPELSCGLPLSAAQAALLDPSEFELIRQATAAALTSGDEFEIEQMVRLRGTLPVRRRIQVRPERDAGGAIVALRIVLERDGEPVADWTLSPEQELADPAQDDIAAAVVEAINAFTAVVLHAEAVKRQVERKELAEVAASNHHILVNAHRAWRHIGSFCRKHAVAAA